MVEPLRTIGVEPPTTQLAGSQTLNRYAYVINTPLSYTDPSGFIFGRIFDAIVDGFISIADTIKSAIVKAANAIRRVLASNAIVRAVVVIAVAIVTQ